MGLICGKVLNAPGSSERLSACLSAMLYSQRHRDAADASKFLDVLAAIGMVNSHDGKGAQYEGARHNDFPPANDGIHVFIDGVVLGGEKHLSGCEIVANTYRKWGLDFVHHVEGEFACAIWDGKKQVLILMRDILGHKPLHYYVDSNQMVFSSEIKGILSAGILPEMDLVSLSDFLTLNIIPAPMTMFRNIMQIPSGHMLVCDRLKVNLICYWKPRQPSGRISISFDEAVSQFEHLFKAAVQKRIVNDEIFCFLSGGIDSSAIVSFAAELSTKPVHAVTISFDEKDMDELRYARLMAAKVGAKHHHVVAKPDSFLAMLNTLVAHHDSPFTDMSAYPTYYAGKLAGAMTNLILTGDAADQLLGGSDHYVFALRNGLLTEKPALARWVSSQLAGMLAKVSGQPSNSYFSRAERRLYRHALPSIEELFYLRSYFPDQVKEFLCTEDMWKIHKEKSPYRYPFSWFQDASVSDRMNQYLFADSKFYLVDDLMAKVDRMCMAHHLETLSPFQDRKLCEFIFSLPSEYKINVGPKKEIITKHILRAICKDRFPREIMVRKKQGFGIPIEAWLRQNDCRFIKDILLDGKALSRTFFRKSRLVKFVDDFINHRGDYFYANSCAIAGLLTLELFMKRYFD